MMQKLFERPETHSRSYNNASAWFIWSDEDFIFHKEGIKSAIQTLH
jgi:hypothetical protein